MAGKDISISTMDTEESTDVNRPNGQAFSITAAGFTFVYNFILAMLCIIVPVHHGPLVLGIVAYAGAACVLSIVGLIGIMTGRTSLVNMFTVFLCIDIFVSGVCRLLALDYIVEMFDEQSLFCQWFDPTLDPVNFQHNVVTGVQWQELYSWDRVQKCRHTLDTVHFVAMALNIGTAIVQGILALALRRYGNSMAFSKSEVPSRYSGRDLEKTPLLNATKKQMTTIH